VAEKKGIIWTEYISLPGVPTGLLTHSPPQEDNLNSKEFTN